MPKHTLSMSAAPSTPERRRTARSYATRVATVATTSAAAALLAVMPAGPAPQPAAAAPASASVPAPAVSVPVAHAAVSTAAAPSAARAASAVQLALGKVGARYRWGGTGPSSFDCSGLVNWAFDQVGVDLPRTSRALSRVGTPVSRGNLRPGDLVFFYSPVSHVGIYIGGGRMVHASTSGKPVAVASISGRPYHSARRVA